MKTVSNYEKASDQAFALYQVERAAWQRYERCRKMGVDMKSSCEEWIKADDAYRSFKNVVGIDFQFRT